MAGNGRHPDRRHDLRASLSLSPMATVSSRTGHPYMTVDMA